MTTLRTRTKICGLTRPEDARCAAEAGADALGVILHADSPRTIGLRDAAEVFSAGGLFVARVGVFVDAPDAVVEEAVSRLALDYVQFHGSESPERCARTSAPVIKALRVGDAFDEAEIMPYMGLVAGVLVDSLDPRAQGGTGSAFPWRLVEGVAARVPLLLAGGLKPTNVAEAIAQVRPFAVDVSSGVERAPGIKDHAAIRAFCAAVSKVDDERTHP